MAVVERVPCRLPDQGATAHRVRRRAALSAAVIVGYFLLAIVAFWPALPNLSGHIFGFEGDFVQAVWFVGWVAHALAHGLNPFWSNAVNVPFGVNLGQNTEAPLLGLLSAPISLAFSPLVATNLLLLLGMPISATAAFVVLRKWDVWRPAAALGGLLYGFSPYMVGQSQGHPSLVFEPVPPLIAMVLVSIFRGQGNTWRFGIWLGLLVSAQYLISPELLATVALFALVALACTAVRHPEDIAEITRVAARPLGVALAVVLVLLAYPVWLLVAGPQHVTGPTFPLDNPYHNDLLSFVVPGPLQRISLGLHSLSARVLGYSDSTDGGGYIGIPLLIMGGILTWRSRHRPRTQLALFVFLASAILSLGPQLTVDGRLTHIPLPFLVIGHVPILDSILPVRLSFETGAFLAALIAFGLDDMRQATARGAHVSVPSQEVQRRSMVLSAGVILVVLVVTQLPRWPYATPPVSGLPSSLNRIIPAGNPVTLTYPYDTASVTEPMFWQAMDGYRFRLLGGDVRIRGANGQVTNLVNRMNPPELQEFLASQEDVAYLGPKLHISPTLVAETKTTILDYHIRMIIVDRSLDGSGPVMRLFRDALGPPSASSGTFTMWADWRSFRGNG